MVLVRGRGGGRMTGVQMSLFGEKTDEEKVRDWLLKYHELVQRVWKRNVSLEEFLESRFRGWEGGSCDVKGYTFYSFNQTKLEFGSSADDKRLTMTKRKVFDLFGLPVPKNGKEEE